METIRLTMAQAIVRFLNNQYIVFDGKEQKFIKGFFTIFGHGNVLGLGQALEQDRGDLEVHQGRNEQGMVHTAIGYAKQKHRRQIYACTSSIGPGAANMVTGAATATANRIPVLLFPGDTYACRQPDPVLQQVEQFHDLTLTTNDAYKAVSKYFDRIYRPEQIMFSLINAMRVLTDPAETGAVTIAIPQDVQGESYDYPISFFNKRIHRIERRIPTEGMINDAFNIIKNKKKPFIICGGGVRYSEAGDALKEFAERFNIPFGETQAGKSTVTWDYPLNMGGIGTTGNLASNVLAKEADLIIGVGTRYTDFTTASKWLFQNPEVEFLNINVASFDACKLDGVKVVADAKTSLEILTIRLQKEKYKSAYTNEIRDIKDKWNNEVNRLFNVKYEDKFIPEIRGHLDDKLEEYKDIQQSSLTQTRVLGVLDDILDDSSIIVGASGSLPGDLQRVWRPKEPDTYHMEYGYSCMGYEVNASLGVKLAQPEREVYAMVGDGSYMMLHSELVTSIQEGAKINILLFDNMEFGCINNLQMSNGMRSFGTEMRHRNDKTGLLDGKLIKIDFAMNAASYGCKTYTVRTEEDLVSAINDAKKQDVSTLIDIKVLPKTMTDGYESFWRVGNAEVAEKESIINATEELKKRIDEARRY
ncbi:3D-(3,5/4)-trihydroxycyclohexane-1,2-dione hydrolase [Vallitalea longa]|uniref:3D-(3,5/4)-trihydroxycyclohexane-1,2-dione hydrolase n=1 Tax=Vallitalea longa TaxID=2936439 RepID=A0A9W6DG10_9FIRM|nr:3D-(3,5/4)-trihydroxycyclohexane-1,2-dione acylhydrolase (decyclizing) [Vallitalea longa]GKX29269.1 3D-(3,5/4)-trihydroxycyclohexane-1,2-dione hydrolase [Vallitalea longa]